MRPSPTLSKYESHYDRDDKDDDQDDDYNVEDYDKHIFSSADHQCGPLPPCPESRPNLPLITGDHHDYHKRYDHDGDFLEI